MKRKFLIALPFLLALIISAVIIVLMPDIFRKYKLTLTGFGVVDKKDGKIRYEDLNGDGFSEQVISFTNTEGKAGIKVTNRKNQITGQWNFNGQLVPRAQHLACGDYDHSGETKIFVFLQRGDSLYVDGILPGNSGRTLFSRYITALNMTGRPNDYGINTSCLVDLNNDGYLELLFEIMAGFPLQPRRLVAFDIYHDSVFFSPPSGSLLQIVDVFDLDRDGYPEIFCDSKATNNYPDTSAIHYHDRSAWLMVFDHDLRYLFPPVEFKGFTSDIYAIPFACNGKPRVACLLQSRSAEASRPRLLLYDTDPVTLMADVPVVENPGIEFDIISAGSDRSELYMLTTGGYARLLDDQGQTVKKISISNLKSSKPLLLDIDQDQADELVFFSPDMNQLMVLRNDFSDPAELGIPVNKQDFYEVSVKRNGTDPPELFIQCGDRYYLCAYFLNPLFLFKYPAYLVIYLLALLFILAVGKIQRIVLRQRYNDRKRIAELQLVVLKNQIDPHFTFNVLTSVSSMVAQEKPDEANRKIALLSKLIRECVETSDIIYRTLGEEITFVRNYLELERSRKLGLFEFTIDVRDDVDTSRPVPKMIVQLLAENSLKHGIRPKGQGGIIGIFVSRDDRNLLITVRDNGIGRKAARTLATDSTGRGLKVIDQIFALLNQYNHEKLDYEITDLADGSGAPCGTEVKMTIPLNLKYVFYE